MSDLQTGLEKTVTYLLPMLAGANIIYGSGMLELGMTFSYGQYVADNEIVRVLRRTLEGIPVSEDTMALDVVSKVGPGGHYLLEDHTSDRMKTAHVLPKFIDRDNRSEWVKNGSVTFIDSATKKAIDIIENHKAKPLPDTVLKELRAIVEQADKVMTGHK